MDKGAEKKKEQEMTGCHGFDRGLEAEMILGLCEIGGVLRFFIQFKGSKTEMVKSSVAFVKIPEMVIAYLDDNRNLPTRLSLTDDSKISVKEFLRQHNR